MNNVTSREFRTLKLNILDLLAQLRDAQAALTRTHESAAALGLDTKRRDNESEIEYLGRLATEACNQEHDLTKAEAQETITQQTTGIITQRGPRSFFGRSLNRIANVLG